MVATPKFKSGLERFLFRAPGLGVFGNIAAGCWPAASSHNEVQHHFRIFDLPSELNLFHGQPGSFDHPKLAPHESSAFMAGWSLEFGCRYKKTTSFGSGFCFLSTVGS
eukprot:s2060_g5.t1